MGQLIGIACVGAAAFRLLRGGLKSYQQKPLSTKAVGVTTRAAKFTWRVAGTGSWGRLVENKRVGAVASRMRWESSRSPCPRPSFTKAIERVFRDKKSTWEVALV